MERRFIENIFPIKKVSELSVKENCLIEIPASCNICLEISNLSAHIPESFLLINTTCLIPAWIINLVHSLQGGNGYINR